MSSLLKLFFIAVAAFSLVACSEKDVNPNCDLTLDDFSTMRVSDYVVSLSRLKQHLDRQVRDDRDTVASDYFLRNYYQQGGRLLWVDRQGVDRRADTLLAYLRHVDKIGFSPNRFRVPQIEADLQRMRHLQFDTLHTASRVVARLEYNLTKSYLRYVTGQRFGYVNPRVLLNRIDLVDTARISLGYRTLFDVGMDTPNRAFYQRALAKVEADSVAVFLHDVQPVDSLYRRFAQMLQTTPPQTPAYSRIMANMERRRWRTHRHPQTCPKYVMVNVPAFMLTAVDGETTMQMRVGLGAVSTKTPLLVSDISRMDLNPQWIIPRSIIRNSVVRHIGDSAYFARNHYIVRERSTGKTVSWPHFTSDMLLSPAYSVVQKGGEGNSLGRIVFRFPNSFSVYLHDTSSRGFFRRAVRAVSHGCVRVERPYDLAVFLLADKDPSVKAKIQYSMTAMLARDGEAQADTLKRRMVIRSKSLDPVVPLFITYYTLYPDPQGHMCEYADIYGYDAVINRYLNNYR